MKCVGYIQMIFHLSSGEVLVQIICLVGIEIVWYLIIQRVLVDGMGDEEMKELAGIARPYMNPSLESTLELTSIPDQLLLRPHGQKLPHSRDPSEAKLMIATACIEYCICVIQKNLADHVIQRNLLCLKYNQLKVKQAQQDVIEVEFYVGCV
ncbi:hypothetical protein EV363DRAFT_1295570 [Boletus edulis]|nr:hypothetical protein EV363DRAFT_1295570 [Boletus edulis]